MAVRLLIGSFSFLIGSKRIRRRRMRKYHMAIRIPSCIAVCSKYKYNPIIIIVRGSLRKMEIVVLRKPLGKINPMRRVRQKRMISWYG